MINCNRRNRPESGLAVVVKPAQKILPTAEVKLQLLKNVIERLTEHDRYLCLGKDHFARLAGRADGA